MGLFVRQDVPDSRQIYYSLQQEAKFVIVGLGNPEPEYAGTRHNLGFAVIDKLAEHYGVGWVAKKDHQALMAEAAEPNIKLLLVKPQTFMNHSGQTVSSLLRYYKLSATDVLVIHDELDLPLGEQKLKQGGGAAGHNGIKSIISAIGEDFWRLRLGIGPKKPAEIDSADFVLGKFSPAEKRKLKVINDAALTTIHEWIVNR